MDPLRRRLVEAIHRSPHRAVLAVTGGGSSAISDLLRVPGASNTVLEAVVPYARESLEEFLGRAPGSACRPETALAMARRARERAGELGPEPQVGIGATASLTSLRPKRGALRCHVATSGPSTETIDSCFFHAGDRTRDGQEEICALTILRALARACDLAPQIDLGLLEGESLASQRVLPPGELGLLLEERSRITVWPDGELVVGAPPPAAILPGSFDPLHEGHRRLARAAAHRLGTRVHFEISIENVEKPPLDEPAIRDRLAAFSNRSTVELTRTPRFVDKSREMPGVVFVVGADTARRIVDPRYYAGDAGAMADSLEQIRSGGCRFLVAGRLDEEGKFQTLSAIDLPPAHADLFEAIPEEEFRLDLSSTEIRGEQR